MQREFLSPKPPFRPGTLYRDKGESSWKHISDMPMNEQQAIVFRLEDDFKGRRHVYDARIKGAKTPIDILNKVVPELWGRLTPQYDIDDNNLNFETI